MPTSYLPLAFSADTLATLLFSVLIMPEPSIIQCKKCPLQLVIFSSEWYPPPKTLLWEAFHLMSLPSFLKMQQRQWRAGEWDRVTPYQQRFGCLRTAAWVRCPHWCSPRLLPPLPEKLHARTVGLLRSPDSFTYLVQSRALPLCSKCHT